MRGAARYLLRQWSKNRGAGNYINAHALGGNRMDLYEHICRHLEEGQKGILATVARTEGSTPRNVGAKMFVGEDGKTFGSIGGGRLESDACLRALEVMGKGWATLFSRGMDGMKMEETVCGGQVEVLLEPVTARHLDLYRKIDMLTKEGKKGLVVTKFGENIFAKSVLAEDMSVTGDVLHGPILDWCRNLLYEKRPVLIGGVLAEPLPESFPLYLFGAGHVAQFVSKTAKIAGFDVTVIDDRVEFANRERFPDADVIITEEFREAFKGLRFTGNEYVVVVTRSHETDAQVLEEVLKKPTKYVGMIGSKKKIKAILDRLRQKGIGDAVIKQVHAPIGIPIHAETPQEIAISIAAQLVTIRNGPTVSREKSMMMVG